MSRASNLGLGAATLAVVALCVAAAVSGSGGAAQIDQAKPEGVVQSYLNAVVARDFDKAVTYLSADSQCTVADFDASYISSDIEVTLRATSVSGGTATVDVSVTTGGDLIGGFTEQHIYRLAQSAGQWSIKGIPWPLYQCGVAK